MKHLVTVAIVLYCAFSFCSCSKMERPVPQIDIAKANSVVFIFKTDSTEAMAFRQLMQANNCGVTLLDKSEVGKTDFSDFRLIVAGHNTDALTPAPGWSSADTAAINQSGKPILLIGLGGMQLAKKLGNDISLNNCSITASTGMIVIDPASLLYKFPNAIDVGSGASLKLYEQDVSAFSYFADSKSPEITLIGGDALPQRFPLASEDRYSVFGFTGPIQLMTTTGKNLLVNYVYQAGKLTVAK